MGIGASGAAMRSGVAGAAALVGGMAMGAGRGVAGVAGTVGSATGAAANAYHASRQSGGGFGKSVGSAFGSALGHSILGVGATAQNVLRGARNNGAKADTLGTVKKQFTSVWSRHKELMDETKQRSSMSAPGAEVSGTGGSRQDFSGIGNVSSAENLKAPTAEELSKRLSVGGDINHA